MDYLIEELSIDNALDYARVNALAWKQSYKGIVDDDYLELINTEEEIEKLANRLKSGVNNPTNKAFLLRVNNKPVGIVRVRKAKNDNYSDYGELGAIYLLDEVKKQGYGKILFDKAVSELKKMGYEKMYNGCIEGNPSNDFYKHMGGKYMETHPFKIPNGQELEENTYCYEELQLKRRR